MNEITIIIPAKNEGAGIDKIINSVKVFSGDIIVVDANSGDGTREACERNGVSYLFDNGKGKGAAMAIGVLKAKFDDVVFFDADGSHDEKTIPEFIKLLKETNVDMITVSRRLGGSREVDLSSLAGFVRSIGADFLVFLVNRRYKAKLTDVLYSFRAIRKNTFFKLELKEAGFGVEQEMVMNALQRGFKVIEIPSCERMRGWGKSKLNVLQGIYFIWMIFVRYFKN